MSPLVLIALIFGLSLLAFGLLWWAFGRQPVVKGLGDLKLQIAKVGEWDIRYHKSGRGPYMLLLHGIGADLYCWRWILPLLKLHYTIVMPDLPGFGRSSKIRGAKYGLEEQSERLAGFCRQLGIDKFYLVGNSMGGNIALWHAANFPDQCLGCVVIAPATSPSLWPVSARPWLWLARPLSYGVSRPAMRWAHHLTVSKKERVDEARVEETYLTYGKNVEAVRSFLAATESIRDPRLAKRLPEISARVLILWGSEDNLVSRKIIDALESALGAHESYVHLGGGHHLQEDEPEWVSEKIQTFFQA